MKKFYFGAMFIFSIVLLLVSSVVVAQNCEIADVTGTVVDCENNEFFVSLDFEFANTSDSFVVNGNNASYGVYNYGAVPVLIGPLPTDGTNYEFVVTDVDEQNCTDFVELGVVDCDTTSACELSDLVVEFDECTSDSTYRIELNFNHANTSGLGFDLWANGDLFGFYSYNDLPLTINNFPVGSSMVNGLQVCDNDNINCCASENWPTPNCASSPECDIRDLVAEVFDCANGQFYAEINFIHEHTSDSFLLTINQQPVASFMYASLPLTIGPIPISSYNVLISDLLDPDCNEMIVMDSTGCANAVCEFSDLEVEFDECTSDSTYRIFVDFEHVNTSGVGFDLWANGDFFGSYSYNDLPLTINNFPLASGNTNDLQVCDNNNANCCASEFWQTPNCGSGGDCDIRDLIAEPYDCENGEFLIDIDFNYENTSDSFLLTIGQQPMSHYSYANLPLTIGPLSIQNYGILISDILDPSCSELIFVDTADCPNACNLTNLVVEFDECTSDTTYRVFVDFDYVNPTSPYFTAYANGSYFGVFAYADLPLTIDHFPLVVQAFNSLEVCDTTINSSCCTATEWPVPQCGQIGNCEIQDLTVDVTNCVNGEFTAVLDFNHQNSTNGFNVSINGVSYGNYSGTAFPRTFGPLTSNTAYEYIVTDLQFAYCTDTVHSLAEACDSLLVCGISNLEVDFDECTTDTTYRVFVDFDHVNTSGVGFDLWANGEFFGFYAYSALPLTIDNFPLEIAMTNGLQVCDNDNIHCCASTDWPTPNCGQADCLISDLEADPFDCENGLFYVELSFNTINTGDTFEVTGTGVNYGLFTNTTITLGPLNSNTPYNFIVASLEFPNCLDSTALAANVCDSFSVCELSNINIEFDECVSDTLYRVFVDFNYVNTLSDQFELWRDGIFYGTFDYASLPLPVLYRAGQQFNHVNVCDANNTNCCIDTSWVSPVCDSIIECSIFNIVVEEFDCDSFHYFLEVDFNYANVGDTFTLQGNGHFYGYFSYLDLPITLGPFSVNSVVNELVVIDATFMNCLEDVEFEIDCGGNNECGIDELEVEVGDVNGTTFELTFNFEFENVSDSFDAFSGNSYVGTFAYTDLPITITDFPTRNLPHELLRVCDAQFQDCCDVIEFMIEVACEECKISEVNATVVECFGDSIIVVLIDFDIEEGSADGFEIIGNGINYGLFHYADLPVEIVFDYEEGDFVDLIIRDHSTPTCLGYTFVNEANCEGFCELSNLTVDFQECTSDTTYNFILDFDHQGTAGAAFDLFANGQLIGFFNYSDLPLLIEDFVSTGVQIDRFLVCDNDNANCCEDVNVPIPNCITGLVDPDYEKGLKINMLPGEWQIQVSEPGVMTIFDMAGRQIRPNFTITEDYLISDLAAGSYLITWTGHWGIVSRNAVFYGR